MGSVNNRTAVFNCSLWHDLSRNCLVHNLFTDEVSSAKLQEDEKINWTECFRCLLGKKKQKLKTYDSPSPGQCERK